MLFLYKLERLERRKDSIIETGGSENTTDMAFILFSGKSMVGFTKNSVHTIVMFDRFLFLLLFCFRQSQLSWFLAALFSPPQRVHANLTFSFTTTRTFTAPISAYVYSGVYYGVIFYTCDIGYLISIRYLKKVAKILAVVRQISRRDMYVNEERYRVEQVLRGIKRAID